jgi:hypothetical protein
MWYALVNIFQRYKLILNNIITVKIIDKTTINKILFRITFEELFPEFLTDEDV